MKKLMKIFAISLMLLTPVFASASDLGGMRFSFIRGDVQVRTEDTGDWVPASINLPLREGDRIWVPEDGAAELQTKDGSYLRLADRTALEILTIDKDSYQTYLTEGRVYANFRGSRDSLLQVDTLASSARAYERARFNVDVPERGPVNVSVFQGEVNVENRDGSIRVASGEVLSLGEGTYSEKSTLGSPDDWERWNYERDSKIAERRPPSRYLAQELQPYSSDFYDNGRWVHTSDYGYVWTPTVSVSVGWAPYQSGRWVWIGGDYVWVSYEPWGWVPYHYGRWAFFASIGWCWVPPVRGAVYWGPGYVGWVYTPKHVAWVPLAPGEIYYGRGHFGPHSVNITNVNVTNVHVDKVVYKNVNINNAVTTVNHETFVRGKPAETRAKENPFLTEKVHPGRPPIKPEKTSAMPVVREVPPTKRPPEPVREVNVRELKEQRPMVKAKETSVFAPETRPREMPVKANETKPAEKRHDRAKELRQSPTRAEQPSPSATVEKRGSQQAPAATKVQTPKQPGKAERSRSPEPPSTKVQEQQQPAPAEKGKSLPASSQPAHETPKETTPPGQGVEKSSPTKSPSIEAQQKAQGRPSSRGSSQPAVSDPAAKTPKETTSPERGVEKSSPTRSPSVDAQGKTQGRPSNKGISQPVPSEPAARTPKEMKAPERGTDRRMESRSPEKVIEQTRSSEKVQQKSKEVSPPEKGSQQAP